MGPRLLGIRAIPERGFKKGDLKFNLHGEKLHGSWVLVRMRHDRNGGKRTNWLLIKHRDQYAKEGENNDILEEDRSVASGRTMKQIEAGKGKSPKPFMAAKNGKGKPDAVWHSNRGDAAEARAKAKARPAKQAQALATPFPISSRRNSAPRSSGRLRGERLGATRSSSMVIACSCGSRMARRR